MRVWIKPTLSCLACFAAACSTPSLPPPPTLVDINSEEFQKEMAAERRAARENASSERSVADLGSLIKKIALKDKIDESREFAGRLQQSLYVGSNKAGNRTKDRGVRKAPLIVLIGAEMPSVLTEIGFLSNPKEEAMLKKADYRQKIAEALFRGVAQYMDTLSHFSVAQLGN